jgi:hypothetical protein
LFNVTSRADLPAQLVRQADISGLSPSDDRKGIVIMQLRQIETPEKWTEFWLEKFSVELEKLGFLPKDIAAQKSIMRLYLTKNPGNPRTIDIKKMLAFAASHTTAAIASLMLFYNVVSHSEKHLETLAALEAGKKVPSIKKKKRPVAVKKSGKKV